jgi:Alba
LDDIIFSAPEIFIFQRYCTLFAVIQIHLDLLTYALIIQEKDANEIVIKAMGRAINKAVMIVELLKV